MRTTNAPAAARDIKAIINAPLPLNLGFSVSVAGAFVCVSAILSGAVFVRTAFVGFNDFVGEGGLDSVVVGGRLVNDGFASIGFDWVGGIRLVPTFVPTITSGGASTTGGGGGGDGLVLTVGGGAGGCGRGGNSGKFTPVAEEFIL